MEVRRRGGRLRQAHIVLGTHPEETFDPSRRVVRPLPLVAVWQQQHDAGLLPPFGFTAADELVDDRLCAVEEVTELGLSEHDSFRSGYRVAVLEAHGSELREQ